MRESLPLPNAHVVFTEFGESQGILVDLEATKYYRLNETAMLVWKALETKMTPGALVDAVTATYDVSPEQASQSVERLLRALHGYNLVH